MNSAIYRKDCFAVHERALTDGSLVYDIFAEPVGYCGIPIYGALSQRDALDKCDDLSFALRRKP
ncbi:MAG: hypothetical protein ACRD52_00620 [Candidatus Acidiferrales bacterium]